MLGGITVRLNGYATAVVRLKIKFCCEPASRPLIKKRLIMPNAEYALHDEPR